MKTALVNRKPSSATFVVLAHAYRRTLM